MQTRLSSEQLERPEIAQVDAILRTCVHCGFCNATCPTYAILGDELDGPRGRIYQVKSWLEEGREPARSEVEHIDRCLSCLSCVTTCPSGVDYMHLVDYARVEVERSRARNPLERVVRALLARLLTSPKLFRLALRLGRLWRPFASLAPARMRALLDLVPAERQPSRERMPEAAPAAPSTTPRRRIALLRGCVQDALRPQINEAAARVLGRLGCEVVFLPEDYCCGALAHHLGRSAQAHRSALATARRVGELVAGSGVEYVVCTASGCGTMLKDYAQVLRGDAETERLAADVAQRTRDIGELVASLGGTDTPGHTTSAPNVTVAVHSPCSIHHGQRLGNHTTALLAGAGYRASSLADAHLCCGSAGVYNVLQPEMARELRARKVELIERSGAGVVATGNIGCLVQLSAGLRAAGLDIPVVHAVELLDAASEVGVARALAPAHARETDAE
jgi:glycolate oxidase iron-sulfur subunit